MMERKLILKADVLKYILETVTEKKKEQATALSQERFKLQREIHALGVNTTTDLDKLVKRDLKVLIDQINKLLGIIQLGLTIKINYVNLNSNKMIVLGLEMKPYGHVYIPCDEFSEEVTDRIEKYNQEHKELKEKLDELEFQHKILDEFIRSTYAPKSNLIKEFKTTLSTDENKMLDQLLQKMHEEINSRFGIVIVEEDAFFTEQPISGTI